jgi:hypothetical protein
MADGSRAKKPEYKTRHSGYRYRDIVPERTPPLPGLRGAETSSLSGSARCTISGPSAMPEPEQGQAVLEVMGGQDIRGLPG